MIIRKSIYVIVISMIFNNALMMEEEREEVMMKPKKTLWNKFCNGIGEIKGMFINNKIKTIAGTVGGGGVGYVGSQLLVNNINDDSHDLLKLMKKHKTETTILLTTTGTFLGFGAVAMTYGKDQGKKNELLQIIKTLKEQIEDAEEERNKLDHIDLFLGDIERTLLEIEKAEKDGEIKGLKKALKKQEDKLEELLK